VKCFTPSPDIRIVADTMKALDIALALKKKQEARKQAGVLGV
jgi:hypothetical protein